MPRSFSRWLSMGAAALVFGLFLWVVLSPDPEGTVFLQAQRLEQHGETERAARLYQLIADRHPGSPYAPRALEREAELLEEQGQTTGHDETLRRAVNAYLQLAKTYPNDSAAARSLESAAELAGDEGGLADRTLARTIWTQIVQKNGETSEAGASALVEIGHLLIQDNQGPQAQKLLQAVLRKWNGNDKVGAPAQFYLGLCYETLFKNRDYAARAYDQVIAAYAKTPWAAKAKERLGLMWFNLTHSGPPTRRVLLDIAPLPDQPGDDGSIWSALRLALGARGLSGDSLLVRGYALAPFYAGLSTQNPGQSVDAPFDAWENAVGAAGYRYTIKGGGREDEALRDLQDELNAAHLPLVFWSRDGQNVWSVCVGYDSERGEVMLQSRGAQFDTLSAKTWAPSWKIQSQFGKPYTMIVLVPSGQGRQARANPSLTPTPFPTAAPGQTPAPIIVTPPAFVWSLGREREETPIRRTANRAATLLLRADSSDQPLNVAALDLWAQTLSDAAREARTPAAVTPAPTLAPTPSPTNTASPSPYDPTPAPLPTAAPRQALSQTQKWWPFWGDPAKNWAQKRREAAAWCRLAAFKTNDGGLNAAAQSLDQSAAALEGAVTLAATLSASDPGKDPNALDSLANLCRQASQAERQAAQQLR